MTGRETTTVLVDEPEDAPRTRASALSPNGAADGDTGSDSAASREVHKWASSGPRNQPRRTPKSKR